MLHNPRELYDCHRARFDHAVPLSDDELRAMAPSIFAVAAHESRSERFEPIPTIRIVDALRNEGFFPVAAKQSGSRDRSKRDFTKHLLRFRRLDNEQDYRVGDTVFETILQNANDGSSRFELMHGAFKIKCLNSLVAQIGTVESVKVRHLGRDIPQQVIDATYQVVGAAEQVLAAPQDWGRIELKEDGRRALAEAAHLLRFGGDEAVQPMKLLEPRRYDDNGKDLWSTWNVVQEHCLRGGDRGFRAVENPKPGQRRLRRTTSRPINNIDQDVKLNRALWLVGEQLAKTLKAAVV